MLVNATALPSASITDRWAVPPSVGGGLSAGLAILGQRQHAAVVDARGQPVVVLAVEQMVERDLDEIGVTEQAGAVGKAMFQGLGQHVQVGTAAAGDLAGIGDAFGQDAEGFGDHDAARRRRGHGVHPVARGS